MSKSIIAEQESTSKQETQVEQVISRTEDSPQAHHDLLPFYRQFSTKFTAAIIAIAAVLVFTMVLFWETNQQAQSL